MFLVNLIIANIPIKAIVLSLIMPGLGEIYMGKVRSGLPFITIEGISWTSFAYLKWEEKGVKEDYKVFAYKWSGASIQRNDESYWQAIEFNLNYDEYLEKLRREARNLYPDSPSKQGEYVRNHNVGDPWDWANRNLWFKFQELRAKYRSIQDWASVSLGVLIANRVISVLNVFLLSRSSGRLSLQYNFGREKFTAGIHINGFK